MARNLLSVASTLHKITRQNPQRYTCDEFFYTIRMAFQEVGARVLGGKEELEKWADREADKIDRELVTESIMQGIFNALDDKQSKSLRKLVDSIRKHAVN